VERIALRAYEVFLERGGLHGHDVEDWIETERQIANCSSGNRMPSPITTC